MCVHLFPGIKEAEYPAHSCFEHKVSKPMANDHPCEPAVRVLCKNWSCTGLQVHGSHQSLPLGAVVHRQPVCAGRRARDPRPRVLPAEPAEQIVHEQKQLFVLENLPQISSPLNMRHLQPPQHQSEGHVEEAQRFTRCRWFSRS